MPETAANVPLEPRSFAPTQTSPPPKPQSEMVMNAVNSAASGTGRAKLADCVMN